MDSRSNLHVQLGGQMLLMKIWKHNNLVPLSTKDACYELVQVYKRVFNVSRYLCTNFNFKIEPAMMISIFSRTSAHDDINGISEALHSHHISKNCGFLTTFKPFEDANTITASKNSVKYTYTDANTALAPDSLAQAIPHPPSISKVEYVVGGINTITYGLAELHPNCKEVACLWLLHPRLQTQACMAPFAAQFIKIWNSKANAQRKGLVAVSFDQRNHGSREISPLANEAWRGLKQNNERHAQDMFSCYHGTSCDTSQLLDHIESYIFCSSPDTTIVQNIVMGISLGGHAAWHVLMQDQRFSAAMVVIGCPDFTRLMSDRARLSKRKAYTSTSPPGTSFVGSSDFPRGLVSAVRKFDPAGLLWSTLVDHPQGHEHLSDTLSADEKAGLLPLMSRTLGNKRIINLSGGSDKLVPYAAGKPFIDWLKKSISMKGFFHGAGLHFEDYIIPDAGHEVPRAMAEHMERFLVETLECERVMNTGKMGRRGSRI